MDDPQVPSDHRGLLLGMTRADWAALHGFEKHLAKAWGRVLGVHPKAVDFRSGFGSLLAAKLSHARPSAPSTLIASLKVELHRAEANADNPDTFRDQLPDGLRRILALPFDEFDDPDWFRFEASSDEPERDQSEGPTQTTGEGVPTEAVVTNETGPSSGHAAMGASPSPCAQAMASLADLVDLQEPLAQEISALSTQVRDGLRLHGDPGARLEQWCALWEDLPEEANNLLEARAFVTAQHEREDALVADERLKRSVVELRFAGGSAQATQAIAVVQEIARQASVPLDPATRTGLESLMRVLGSDWAEEDDMQKVQEQFGPQVLAAAARLAPRTVSPSASAHDGSHASSAEARGSAELATAPLLEVADNPGHDRQPAQALVEHVQGEASEASIGQVPEPSGTEHVPGIQARSPETPGEPDLSRIDLKEAGRDSHGSPKAETGTRSPEVRALQRTWVGELEPEVRSPRQADNRMAQSPAEGQPARTEPFVANRVSEASRPSGAKQPVTADADPDYLPNFDNATARGDFALAYWFAVAGHDDVRARAARMLVIGMSAEVASGTPHPRANALAAQLGTDLHEANPALSELIAAAVLPAALLLPPYSEAAITLNSAQARLGDDCPRFIRTANLLTYERGSGLRTVEAPILLASRDRAKAELDEHITRAPSRKTRYQRATEVWRELIRKQGQLGSLAASALARPGDESVRRALRDVEDRGIDRIIKDTDHQLNPNQAKREGIIAGAKQELTSHIGRYLDAIRTYVEAEESVRAIDKGGSHNTDLIEQLLSNLTTEFDEASSNAPVTSAVALWLRGRLSAPATPPTESEDAALARPLARAFELHRSASKDFDHGQLTVALVAAQAGRSDEDAFLGYVARHDYVGLEILLDTVRASEPTAWASMQERERRARLDSREHLHRAVERTRLNLSRALAVTSLAEAEAQLYQDRLERIAREPNPHYRDVLADLLSIDDELARRQQERLDAAQRQLDGLQELDAATRARVAKLIQNGDLLNAEEFLAQLSNGATTLPEEDAADETLAEFWPAFSRAASESGSASWFADRLSQGEVGGKPLPHASASERIRSGIIAWDRLATEGRVQGFDVRVRDVLQSIGFQQVTLGQRFTPGRTSSYNVFEAKYDGYALIPTFGSHARGSYAIFLCWERKTVDGLLQAVRAAQVGQPRPTLILYFQTLKPAERRTLTEHCRRKGLPHLVVDHAAMAYLGTREEARLDVLMHACLPFAGPNPYTPFALGDVPREVFYGRRDELRAVQDPHGPLFVYGGRQLGKSALLKTAMSEFQRSGDHNVSIYLDLKAEGVGEWRKADELWRVLLPYLQAKGIVTEKVSRQQNNPTVVSDQVAAWLEEDRRRRLLLLLDESDAFLDEDSRPRAGGKGQFMNVYLLKNLMNQSERRFKPVFAGLHQVQRFHKESNGPMAHVGTEISIGPLPPAEAYKLVVRPLEAIGYRFVSPDVVWRLLSHTNYQASLIQLFCSGLVNHLKTRRLALDEPPTRIDAQTVDSVYENKELRGQIAQRFEWTIQLDNRYRVIALVAAWLNLLDEAAVSPVQLLRSHCTDFWPVGFDGVTQDEFRALLDEMVGLGVLVRNRQDHYGMRSPNVIRLLGSKDEIERKLMESSSLELPTVFDPTRYRRKLGDGQRSPITEAQAARMLVNAPTPTVVIASPGLGADRIGQALVEIADSGEGVEVYATSADLLSQTLTDIARQRRPRHVLLDARGADRTRLVEGIRKLSRQSQTSKTFTCTVLVDPGGRRNLGELDSAVREVVLKTWSDAELHAVEPEADVPLTSETREKLLNITGGWPDVLDPVLRLGRRSDVSGMLSFAEDEAQRIIAEGWGALSGRLGIQPGSEEEGVLVSLVAWGEPIAREDLADLVGLEEPRALTDTLEMLLNSGTVQLAEGLTGSADPSRAYLVNPLVALCLKADS